MLARVGIRVAALAAALHTAPAAFLRRNLAASPQHSMQEKHLGSITPRAPYYRQTLYNLEDLQYGGDVSIDSQVLRGVIDTGSFDVVFFPTVCATCGLAGQEGYDIEKKVSLQLTGKEAIFAYGSGVVSVEFTVGTFAVGPLSVPDLNMSLATAATMPVLSAASFQAIVGVGPPASETSVLQRFGTKIFSACLKREQGAPGYIVWNDLEPARQPVSFAKVPVVGTVTWGVQLTNFGLDGPEGYIDLGCRTSCAAILDTGTSLITVPTEVYNVALERLRALDTECSDFSRMPSLVFSLGGVQYSLPPSAYIGIVAGYQVGAPPFFHGHFVKVCNLLLMDGGSTVTQYGPLFVMGMPFFRYFYTTFVLEGTNATEEAAAGRGREIWTAPASHDCEPAPSEAHAVNLERARHGPLWHVNASKLRGPRHRGLVAAQYPGGITAAAMERARGQPIEF